jgi:hypothetical protein
MIRYSLTCERAHDFDSWFDSSAAFDRLSAAGLVECPHCGSSVVRKALMAPNIATGAGRAVAAETAAAMPEAAPAPAAGMLMAAPDPKLAALRAEALAIARAIRDHVHANADYVGPRFAEEARRIHFGEVEQHGIYGEASPDEVKQLAEDGIEVHPLPRLPEDGN